MADTIVGGAYLAPDGKTLVDAENRPLEREAQSAAKEHFAARAEENAKAERELAQQNELARAALRDLVLGQPTAARRGSTAPAEDEGGKGRGKSKE